MQFTKMQGVGNDFVVLDAAMLPSAADLADLAIRLCDRHFGVGADGLLLVGRDAGDAAFFMRMFNPDGTEDMCGNGLRCVGLWAFRAGRITDKTPFEVATKEGRKTMTLISVSPDQRSATVQVGMGTPKFAPLEIPFCAGADRIVGFPLSVGNTVLPITTLNTGSTHTVIFGPAPDEETFQRLSPQIERHPLFPERTTVLWATPQTDGTIAVRIWERGVGETWGCGTGACAVGVAAQLQGITPVGTGVSVVSRGGTLGIDWAGDDSAVQMTGPAEFVFDGEFCASPKALPDDYRQTQF